MARRRPLPAAGVSRRHRCAMAIHWAFPVYNQEHSDEPALVRIGLHNGDLVQEMQDFFGKNVILASRIADQAQGGQIMVASLLKELTERAWRHPVWRGAGGGAEGAGWAEPGVCSGLAITE